MAFDPSPGATPDQESARVAPTGDAQPRLDEAERELVSLREALAQARHAQEDTLAIVSHDLKNPMSALLLGIQRLGRMADPERRAQADALEQKLERTVRGMNRLIEGLLDLARLEAGRFVLERRAEPAGQLLRRALEPLGALATDRKLTLTVELAEPLPALDCDPDRVAQVLANLVGNAIKFTPEGGGVRVRAARAPDGLVVSVEDDGPGVPAEWCPHLFDRHWQPPGGRRRGHGIGLSIVKGIVEAHGGRAWVESEAGRGATFRFTLPAAP
ncbi:MAG: HAMP domain-containing sensor histidine kinase [Anaeromyxobacter sp.]